MAFFPSTMLPPHFTDDDGTLLSGGTIEAYIAGTSTPANLYTDSAGTSAGTSVTLNARGEPEVSGSTVVLWFDFAVSYKLVLKDSDGTTIWTVDGVGSSSPDWIRLPVEFYGAMGDGSTDDGPAIQLAVEAAAAIIGDVTAYGGPGIGIWFQPGKKYRIATKVTVNNVDGVGFYSDPSRGAILLVTDTTLVAFELGDTTAANSTYGIHFYGLHFKCTSDSTTTTALDIYRCIEMKIMNCTFDGFAYSVKAQKISQSWITLCSFTQTSASRSATKAQSFLQLAGDSSGSGGGLHITDCEFIGVAGSDLLVDAFLVKAVDGLYVENCHFNFYNYGLHISPPGTGDSVLVSDIQFSNSYFDGGGSPVNSVFLEGTVDAGSGYQDISFSNTLFRGASVATQLVEVVITDNSGFVSGGSKVRNFKFDNCRFRLAAATAIRAQGTSADASYVEVEQFTVSNCNFERNNTGGAATTSGVQLEVESAVICGNSFAADDMAATRCIQATLSQDNSGSPSLVCIGNDLTFANCTGEPINWTDIAGGSTVVADNNLPGPGGLTYQQYRLTTTNNTQTTIFTRTIPLNRAGYIRAVVTGMEQSASSPDYATYVIEAGFFRGSSGNAAFMGSDPTTAKSEQSGGTPSASIDLSTNDLRVRVTGVAATTMDWAAQVEVIYAR